MKRMIRFSRVVMTVAVLLAFAGTGGAVAQDRTGPRIVLNEERFDFGKVAAGATAVHLFDIRNAGDEVLEINKVHTS